MKSSIGPLAMSWPLPMTTRLSAISAISREQVRRDQHRPALPGQVLEQLPQPLDALRVEPVGGLVEDQRVRIAEQRGRQAEPLPHAEREGLRLLLGHRGRARAARAPRRRAGWRSRWPTASMRRWLRALRVGWNGLASSSEPIRVIGCLSWSNVLPSNVVRPSPRSRPSISRIVVDLPAPFGPRKPVTTPGFTSKLRSTTAGLPLKLLLSPCASMTAMRHPLHPPPGGPVAPLLLRLVSLANTSAPLLGGGRYRGKDVRGIAPQPRRPAPQLVRRAGRRAARQAARI